MTIEIRRVRPDELGESVEALSAAFLERPNVDEVVARAASAPGPGAHVGRPRRGAGVRHVPLMADRDHAAGRRAPPRRRRLRRDGPPDASAPRHPPRDGRRRARRDPRAGRGHGPAPRRRVPDLRSVRVRPGHAGGDLDARHQVGEPSIPAATGRVEYVLPGPATLSTDPRRLRAVSSRAAGRDPPPGLPLGRGSGDVSRRLGPGLEGLRGPPPRRGRRRRRLRPLQPDRGPLGREPADQRRDPRRAARAHGRRIRHALAVPRGDGLGRRP